MTTFVAVDPSAHFVQSRIGPASAEARMKLRVVYKRLILNVTDLVLAAHWGSRDGLLPPLWEAALHFVSAVSGCLALLPQGHR